MKFEKIKNNLGKYFDGPLLITPKLFEDERGYFFESWNKKIFSEIVNDDVDFVQDNQSESNKNVFRGLHYQLHPKGQGKLVRIINGEIIDFIVDIRKDSKTYKSWSSIYLNKKNKNLIWIPIGFAHGFLSLDNQTIVNYKTTDYWYHNFERTLNYNDIDIGLIIPKINNYDNKIIISPKDQNGFSLKYLEKIGETL